MIEKRFTIKNIWGKSLNRLIGVICDDNKDMYMTDVCELLNTLSEENEQLKCGNKNLKSTLNDFINICNRLQANPTDKQTLNVARDMLQNMGKELEE